VGVIKKMRLKISFKSHQRSWWIIQAQPTPKDLPARFPFLQIPTGLEEEGSEARPVL
jgi:hypothetical protein